MSLDIMVEVLNHSRSSLGSRLVLIAIAECAGTESREGWPSLAYMARRANISERAVRNALRHLESIGEITTEQRFGTSSLYRVSNLRGADTAGVGGQNLPQGSDAGFREGGTLASAEPSLNRQGTKNTILVRSRCSKTSLSDDFVLSEKMAEKAKELGCLDPSKAFEAFTAYALSNGKQYANWYMAWVQWCLHHGTFSCPCGANSGKINGNVPMSFAERDRIEKKRKLDEDFKQLEEEGFFNGRS